MRWLFGPPPLRDEERTRCLDYVRTETALAAFQESEADLYNNTLVKYGSGPLDDVAAAALVAAGQRLSAAAQEILGRRRLVPAVPEPAEAARFMWDETYRLLASWAEAQASAIEAMAEGREAAGGYVRQLLDDSERAKERALREEKSLLERLRLSAAEVTSLYAVEPQAGDWYIP